MPVNTIFIKSLAIYSLLLATAVNAQPFSCITTEEGELEAENTLYVDGATGYYSYISKLDGVKEISSLDCGFSQRTVVCVPQDAGGSTTMYSINVLQEYSALTIATFVPDIQAVLPEFPYQNSGLIEQIPIRCAAVP